MSVIPESWRSIIRDWFLPPAWMRNVNNVRAAVLFNRKYASLLRQNAELYQKHADRKRCFVIGNGPSLKTQDLRPLGREITIVANSFFQHPDHALVDPSYCCCGDERFTDDQPKNVAWLREMEAKLPNTALFFRPNARWLFEKHNLFQLHRVYFIVSTQMVENAQQVSVNLQRPVNVGLSTGTLLSIPLALYLGFREIYLIGFDANWSVAEKESSLHFYDTNPYFPEFDTMQLSGDSTEGQLLADHQEFASHRLLRDKATLMGARIINATNGGRLDMYPRVRYEELF